MLCRTASDLYWMARHVERAENTARLVDLTQRIALLPERLDPGKDSVSSWRRALDALGLLATYTEDVGEVEVSKVMHYLTLDPRNPSSIYRSLQQARELGRAQRGAITAEMYQELNTSWLDVHGMDEETSAEEGLSSFLEWVKLRSAAFRGVTMGTMGREEGYSFMALGTFVERADNTVRLLDIKYAQAQDTDVHEERNFIQYYQWSAMLQALSAFEVYRRVYRDAVSPLHVAELLIFRQDMPRSLAVCCQTLLDILTDLADDPHIEAVRLAGALACEIRYGRLQDVLEEGLKPFLDRFMRQLDGITREIVNEFMTSTDPGVSMTQNQSQQTGAMVN